MFDFNISYLANSIYSENKNNNIVHVKVKQAWALQNVLRACGEAQHLCINWLSRAFIGQCPSHLLTPETSDHLNIQDSTDQLEAFVDKVKAEEEVERKNRI